MLRLEGKVLNVFQTPKGKTKNGEDYGGEHRVQLQVNNCLRNGENRVELINLTTDRPNEFLENTGKDIMVDVGAFARNSVIHYYLPTDYQVAPATDQ